MYKILIVDDSKFQRNQIIRVIRDEGFELISAENGKIGLDIFEQQHPDCVFTDLNMPEMDGFELLQRIRSQNTQVPIIVITSDTQQLTYKKCVELGATGMVLKPYKKDDLMAILENLRSETGQ